MMVVRGACPSRRFKSSQSATGRPPFFLLPGRFLTSTYIIKNTAIVFKLSLCQKDADGDVDEGLNAGGAFL